MNCQPGDLAVIVGDPRNRNKYEGAHLKVIADSGRRDCGYVCWVYEPLSPALVAHLREHRDDDICDYWLRPIRDPGDDAVDETLLRNPVPTKETA